MLRGLPFSQRLPRSGPAFRHSSPGVSRGIICARSCIKRKTGLIRVQGPVGSDFSSRPRLPLRSPDSDPSDSLPVTRRKLREALGVLGRVAAHPGFDFCVFPIFFLLRIFSPWSCFLPSTWTVLSLSYPGSIQVAPPLDSPVAGQRVFQSGAWQLFFRVGRRRPACLSLSGHCAQG
jgi:hypothetical protein